MINCFRTLSFITPRPEVDIAFTKQKLLTLYLYEQLLNCLISYYEIILTVSSSGNSLLYIYAVTCQSNCMLPNVLRPLPNYMGVAL